VLGEVAILLAGLGQAIANFRLKFVEDDNRRRSAVGLRFSRGAGLSRGLREGRIDGEAG
jgi:hypothetical protein